MDSDLAYGKGYISKESPGERSRGEVEPHPFTRSIMSEGKSLLFGPDGRPMLHRAQTDEEILELGRKLSAYARGRRTERDLGTSR